MRRSPFISLRGGVAALALVLLASCAAPQAAPVYHLGTRVDSAAGAGVVMVREGDTVWRISERYRLPLRDIIDLNGLTPPYHLKTGQRLQLPPPNEHRAGAGDTVTGIARMYGVPVSQVVSVNQLSPPYTLRQGQVVRIPSTVARPQISAQAAVHRPAAKPAAQVAGSAARPAAPAPAQKQGEGPSSPDRTASASSVAAAASARAPAAAVAPGKQGFIWPVRGKVISSYGPKPGHLHNDGINIAAPRGAAVAAAADGTVAYVGNALASYGNLVLIRHANGLVTAYAHLERVHVVRGDVVKRGQAIGTVGSTGTVASPQLHFEVRRGMESLDPAGYLGA